MIIEQLRALLDRYGMALLQDQERLATLVRHRCPDQPVDALLSAVSLGIIPGLALVGYPRSERERVSTVAREWLSMNTEHSQEESEQAIAHWLDTLPLPEVPIGTASVVVTPAGPSWEEVASQLGQGGTLLMKGGVYRGQLRLPLGLFKIVAEGDVMWEAPVDSPALLLDGAWVEAEGIGWRGLDCIEVVQGWLWLKKCHLRGEGGQAPLVFTRGQGTFAVLDHCQLHG
jgi:hypothetical protein